MNTEIENFLKSKLKPSGNWFKSSEVEIKDEIKKILYSKKFRKWKVDEVTEARTVKVIDLAMEGNKPLEVIYPQGGYKLWRFKSFPEVDWAEFFNISYVIEYLFPIAEIYKPGIKLYYYMHSLVPELHDNLKTEDINAYLESFENLLKEFRKTLPKNFSIEISKDADFYKSREHYFDTLNSYLEQAKKDFEAMSEFDKNRYFNMSKLNLKLDGKEDLTKLSESELKERILKGAYYEKALSYLEEPKVFTKAEDKILLFNKAGNGFISIGTNKTSIAKYWVGTGIIEMREDKLVDRILSPQQYEQIKDKLENVEIDLIDMKNLKNLEVYKGKLSFS